MFYIIDNLFTFQSTFSGRLRHLLDITDPRVLFTSKVSKAPISPETSSRIVRDYYATKINDINKTFMLQSH